MPRLVSVFAVLVALASAAPARAQTVILGSTASVSFTASPDHGTTVAGSSPAVPILDHYEFQVITGTATGAIILTQGLGKPTPDAANTITVPLAATMIGNLLKNTIYFGAVVAVGSGGTSPQAQADRPFAAVGAPATVTNVKVR